MFLSLNGFFSEGWQGSKRLFLYLELSGWLGKKSDLASNEKSGQQGKKSELARNEIRLASKEIGPEKQ